MGADANVPSVPYTDSAETTVSDDPPRNTKKFGKFCFGFSKKWFEREIPHKRTAATVLFTNNLVSFLTYPKSL